MVVRLNRLWWLTIGSILPIVGIQTGNSIVVFSQTTTKLTESARASTRSLGAIKIGMTVRQASMAAGIPFVRMGSGEAQCQYYQPSQQLKGIALMVTDGVISRVDITNPRIQTLSGIKIGDTERQVTTIYGSKIQRQQHKYNSKGHYLIYTPENPQERKYQIVFETDGQHVSTWRFGKAEQVNWVEGCS